MTESEKNQIVQTVLDALQAHSRTIMQLTPVSSLNSGDYIELNGGRRVSYTVLAELISTMMEDDLNGILTALSQKAQKSELDDTKTHVERLESQVGVLALSDIDLPNELRLGMYLGTCPALFKVTQDNNAIGLLFMHTDATGCQISQTFVTNATLRLNGGFDYSHDDSKVFFYRRSLGNEQARYTTSSAKWSAWVRSDNEIINDIATLRSAINTLETSKASKEELNIAIEAEAAARNEALIGIGSSLSSLDSSKASKSELDSNIGVEQQARIQADNALGTLITEEATAREAADTALQSDIDTKVPKSAVEQSLSEDEDKIPSSAAVSAAVGNKLNASYLEHSLSNSQSKVPSSNAVKTAVDALQEQIDAKGILWQSGTAVKAGSLISHEGVLYRAERALTPGENTAEPSSDNADYQALTDKAVDAYTKAEVDEMVGVCKFVSSETGKIPYGNVGAGVQIVNCNDGNVVLRRYDLHFSPGSIIHIEYNNPAFAINYGSYPDLTFTNNAGGIIYKHEIVASGRTLNTSFDVEIPDNTVRIYTVGGDDAPKITLIPASTVKASENAIAKSNAYVHERIEKVVGGYFSYQFGDTAYSLPEAFTLIMDLAVAPGYTPGQIFTVGPFAVTRLGNNPYTLSLSADGNTSVTEGMYIHSFRMALTYVDGTARLYINEDMVASLVHTMTEAESSGITFFNSNGYNYARIIRLLGECLDTEAIMTEDITRPSIHDTLFWLTADDIDINTGNVLGGTLKKLSNSARYTEPPTGYPVFPYDYPYNTLFCQYSENTVSFIKNFTAIASDRIPVAGFDRLWLDSKLTTPSNTSGMKSRFILSDLSVIEVHDDLTARWITVPKGAVWFETFVSITKGSLLGDCSSADDFAHRLHLSQSIADRMTPVSPVKSVLILGDSWSEGGSPHKPWIRTMLDALGADTECCVARAGRQFKSVSGASYTGHPNVGLKTGVVVEQGSEYCDLENQVRLVKRLYEGVKTESESIVFDTEHHPDVCVIAMGTNDNPDADNSDEFIESQIMTGESVNGMPIPKSLEDVDKSNFVGALYFAAQTLYNLFPKTLVVVCLPPQANLCNAKQFVINSQIARVAYRLGLPAINWYSGCGFTTLTCPTRSDGSIPGGGDLQSDGLHPTVEGHIKLGIYTAKEILRAYKMATW